MDSILKDVRYGLRALLRTRGFTMVAVLTLALGIGANTTVFGLLEAVLLRPLPFDHPEQLVKVWGRIAHEGISQNWLSEPEFWDLRDQLHSTSAIAAYSTGSGANLTRDGGEPLRVTLNQSTASLLPMLGVTTVLGRTFSDEEDRPGRDHVAVLDYGFWKTQMAGDRSLVGHSIQLNGEAYTVVGILPEGFTFGAPANLWTPLALDRATPGNRGSHYLEVLARLSPATTPAAAGSELSAIAGRLEAQYPQFYVKDAGFGLYLRPLQADLVGDASRGLVMVSAAVGFVLLIACINLANLLLARGASRAREFAIRSALGAGRRRLVQQLITESVLVAVLGGGCGVLLAVWATEALQRDAGAALPITRPLAIDLRVLLFAFAVSLLTGVLFGLVPALRVAQGDDSTALKDAARGSSQSAGHWLRSGLVVAEIALAVVVLVAAGLLMRSLGQLLSVDPGFDARRTLTARLSLPQAQYRDITSANAFFSTLEQRVRALPGVEAAGLTTLLPMTGRNSSGSTFIDAPGVGGLTVLALVQKPYIEADRRSVTPGFFDAMRIPLRRGRVFTSGDSAETPAVIVVDEAFATRIWPGRDPIGQRLAVDAIPNSNPPALRWRTVVGVVGHVNNTALDQLGREQAYLPLAQTAFAIRGMYLAVRTGADPSLMATSVQRTVHAMDSSLPVYEVKAMDDWLDGTVASRRFTMALFVAFGALALLLAAVGTYGVIAFMVGQRTQEIGIRMALGASRRDVLRMIVAGGLRLSVAGLMFGVFLAAAASRLFAALLYGVQPMDLVTFASVAIVLLLTSTLAAWIPAHRATRVNPLAAMRGE